MAFVNLPPNFQDIFGSITDRVAKLETGPNQAAFTADVAYTTATAAQVQAINAGVAANEAASQATIAQSQATIASTQATAAQTSANGKNKNTYSTSAPGTTANTAGDIWYQYGTSGTNLNKVIAQWTGNGGSSWTSVTLSGLVVANLDAGSITTGTLSAIQITAGSGAQAFSVSSTGAMSATGAVISGNITATSGTFTGTINATAGYFGDATNRWSIGAGGITGVGSATITGGAINGSSITTTTGRIGGFYINTDSLSSGTGGTGFRISTTGFASFATLNATGFQMLSSGALTMGNGTISGFSTLSGTSISTTGAISAGTTLAATTTLTVGTTFTVSGASNHNGQMNYAGVLTGSGTGLVLVATGSRIALATSSERFKQNIEYVATDGWLDKVLAIKPITYKTNEDFTTEGEPNETQYGFLAEDIYDLGGGLEKAVILDPLGDPFSLSYERFTVFLTLAMKEIDARLKTLEGK